MSINHSKGSHRNKRMCYNPMCYNPLEGPRFFLPSFQSWRTVVSVWPWKRMHLSGFSGNKGRVFPQNISCVACCLFRLQEASSASTLSWSARFSWTTSNRQLSECRTTTLHVSLGELSSKFNDNFFFVQTEFTGQTYPEDYAQQFV